MATPSRPIRPVNPEEPDDTNVDPSLLSAPELASGFTAPELVAPELAAPELTVPDPPAPAYRPRTGRPRENDSSHLLDAPELRQTQPSPTPSPETPSQAPVSRPQAPTASSGAPARPSSYAVAGTLTSVQIINSEPDKYVWLDPLVIEITGHVQNQLVSENKGALINLARTDPTIRKTISEDIDRIALSYMLANRMIRGDEGKMVVASVVNEIVGLGPLEPLWQDPEITEVIVNGPNDVWVEQHGKLVRARACRFRDQEHLLEVCQRILSPLNRKVDFRDPLADGRLPDGSRVNVVHQVLAPKGPLLTIRRFPEYNRTMVDLVNMGSMDKDMALLLADLVTNKASLLVVGATSTGKLCDVNTPVPTPNGFVKLGDIEVGDIVFDENGNQTLVIGAYDPEYDLKSYEVVFSDGSVIVAGGDHLWLTETRSARVSRGRVRKHTRKRETSIPEEDLAKLSDILDSIPSDSAVDLIELSHSMGGNARTWEYRFREIAKGLPVVGKKRSAQGYMRNVYMANELIGAGLKRWSRPWHDQRHLQEAAKVRTTDEIRETLIGSPDGHSNHSIRVAGVAQYPDQPNLPIAPYLLGVWLGDGYSREGKICGIDHEIAETITAMGYELTARIDTRSNRDANYRIWKVDGLKTDLAQLNLIQRTKEEGSQKRIPDAFLFSGEQQRRDLLAGLLDTDGNATRQGTVEFSNSNETLARQVYTLVCSLGYKASIRSKIPKIGAKEYRRNYTVSFSPDRPVFRLSRKNAVWEAGDTKRIRDYNDRKDIRYIVDVREVPSVPMRCIRVASESHLFLIGDSYIPTHNTTFLNSLSVAIPKEERIVTIEDSLELRLSSKNHVAAMEARQADAAGENQITIRQLVRNSLRMRPDRIIVGEIRDEAALDMLQACNTGHEGSMSTVHANGPNEAISRMGILVAQGGEIPEDKVEWLVGSALDIIVMLIRYEDGSRRVSGVYEVPDVAVLSTGVPLICVPLWEWEQTGVKVANGRDVLLGEYVKKNDVSEPLARRKGLQFAKNWTWDALVQVCEEANAEERASR